ncbi:MAG: DUF1614 domain-containing protein [Peptococcales bacterium]|jgi:uncharacterized membrane protein
MRINLGVIILLAISILIYFGLAQRVLDRMRLSDKSAFLVIAALIVGSFIDIPLYRGNINISINVGGGIVPLALSGYLLSKAGTSKEKIRALVGALITGIIIYLIGSVLMRGGHNEFNTILDPIYIYPLVAGLTAYIIGRSRRAAFIAATIGVLLLDIFHTFYLLSKGIPGTVHVGGAGAFDSIVLAGIIAVLLAELIGEGRERLQGGPDSRGRDPQLINNLKEIEAQEQNSQRGDKE